MSCGFYFLITLVAFDRVLVLTKQRPQLAWALGVIPFVRAHKSISPDRYAAFVKKAVEFKSRAQFA